ncbi:MAG: DUF481 domain-containing protein [Ferruginibacter sp.]
MRFICFCIFLLVHKAAVSQFSDAVRHYVKFNSTGIINQTTTGNSFVLSNTGSFNIFKKNIALNTAAGWVYGENKQVTSNNDLTTHADLNFFRQGKKLYYWSLVNFDKMYSLGINYRAQAGAGISYNFIDSPNLRINVSDGLLYEAGEIKDNNGIYNDYSTTRNSFRLLCRWQIQNRLTISSIQFYQPSLQSLKDYIIQSTNNIAVKIYQWFSLNATLVYNKASNTNRENLLMTYGIGFEKYF